MEHNSYLFWNLAIRLHKVWHSHVGVIHIDCIVLFMIYTRRVCGVTVCRDTCHSLYATAYGLNSTKWYAMLFMANWTKYLYMIFTFVLVPLNLLFAKTSSQSILGIILTHWSRVTHIFIGNLSIIGSDNGLSPGRRQAITWTNVGILLMGPLGTNFSEMLIEIHTFSFKKIHLKMSSGNGGHFVSASMC